MSSSGTQAGAAIARYQARQIELGAEIVANFVRHTDDARLRWKPEIPGLTSHARTAFEQIGEIVFANRRFLAIFSGEPIPEMPKAFDVFSDKDDAINHLRISARTLAAKIREMSETDLIRNYASHRGDLPGSVLIQFPLRNMMYHGGQINFIQLLYGDEQFYIDENFTSM